MASFAAPKGRQRRAERLPKMPTQMRLVKKAARRRDFAQRYGIVFLCQHSACAAQAHPQQVLVRRLPGQLLSIAVKSRPAKTWGSGGDIRRC
jgi:hypothetical protein